MARLAMDNRQTYVSGSYPTSGGGGYTSRPTRRKAAIRSGFGLGLLGGLLAVAAWGTGIGLVTVAGWHPSPIKLGVLGGVGLGAILGLIVAIRDGIKPFPLAFFRAVLLSLEIALCGFSGGALRFVLPSWLAWPIGGLVLGALAGAIKGAWRGE